MRPEVSWHQKWWLQLAVVYTPYLLGGAFVFASLVKIKGHRFTLPPAASASLHSPERLFETLYQSALYWQFLGCAQLVAGLLLLMQRYALPGALLFLPIIANVYHDFLSLWLHQCHHGGHVTSHGGVNWLVLAPPARGS
jgi:hypothetical protein